MMWKALGALALVAAAWIASVILAHRAGGASSRAQIRELRALVQLWKGRAEQARTGRHRRPEQVHVRAKTALPPWTPTLTVVRMPQLACAPGPDTITMGTVTTGGMRALTDEYIAKLEADGAIYREGLTTA